MTQTRKAALWGPFPPATETSKAGRGTTQPQLSYLRAGAYDRMSLSLGFSGFEAQRLGRSLPPEGNKP